MDRHALPGAGEAQPLLGGSLYVDPVRGNSHDLGQVFPHLGEVGGQLGPLGQDGGVHIAHGKPPLP